MYVLEEKSECVKKFSLDRAGQLRRLPRKILDGRYPQPILAEEVQRQDIWSDGETLWVTEYGILGEIRAYDLETGQCQSAEDLGRFHYARRSWQQTATGASGPTETVMWVSDDEDKKIYAYDLDTKDRLKFFEFNTLDASRQRRPARAVVQRHHDVGRRLPKTTRLYAYAMPSTALARRSTRHSDIAHIESKRNRAGVSDPASPTTACKRPTPC